MKYPSLRLNNLREKGIRFLIEPEGEILEIRAQSSIEISIIGNVPNAIELQVRDTPEGLLLVLYPENGNYEVSGLFEL
jgi:hypothetical protein